MISPKYMSERRSGLVCGAVQQAPSRQGRAWALLTPESIEHIFGSGGVLTPLPSLECASRW